MKFRTAARGSIAIAIAAMLASCTTSRVAEAPAPPPSPAPPVRVAMPKPPSGAAPGLALPAPLADGSFPSPNRALTPAATVWHLRAALNVAALQCEGDAADRYNAALKTHGAAFESAHRRLTAQYREGGGDWRDRFDDAMTRLYNYYAQPPAQRGFCDAAQPVLAEIGGIASDAFERFAAGALAAVDRPFTDYYAAYHRYTVELAAWHASGGVAAPRLTVDPAVLAGTDQVTIGGRIQYASR